MIDKFESLFDELDRFLSDGGEKEVDVPQQEQEDKHKAWESVPDFNLTEIVEHSISPLLDQIGEICKTYKIPFQMCVLASKDNEKGVYPLRLYSNEMGIPGVYAAHVIYDLPHPISHLVRNLSFMLPPGLVLMAEEPTRFFDLREPYVQQVVPLVEQIVNVAKEHNIPFQWGSVISFSEEDKEFGVSAGMFNNRHVQTCEMDAACRLLTLPETIVTDVIDTFQCMESMIEGLNNPPPSE